MKKIIFFLLFVATIRPAFAQTVKYGISGGLNESSFFETNRPAGSTELKGFHAGLFSDIIFGSLSIQPGLFYTTKGQKFTYYFADENAKNGGSPSKNYGNQKINYLQLPVNVLYHLKSGGGNFFFGGGPYVAYGLSASESSNTAVTPNGILYGPETTSSVSFGSNYDDVKRIDFGLNALIGYALKNGLSISAGFEYGLINVDNTGDHERNRLITVSLGYSFL